MYHLSAILSNPEKGRRFGPRIWYIFVKKAVDTQVKIPYNVRVRLFGHILYKGEKSILGAKLIKSNCNYILYHKANVIHSFLYLTGKLKENGGNQTYGQTNKNENVGGSHEKKNNDVMEEAIDILNNYAKKDSQINAGKLEELFRKFGNKSKDIINKLVQENKLIDNDDFYEIIS